MQYFKTLFSGPYMPHGYCFLWNPGLIRLHVISDLLISLSYLSIPFTLACFVRKRRDLTFHWVFLCFGVFILACGATHGMDVRTLWHANYWVSGTIKAITAMASVPTAILLAKLIPDAIALPSPAAMRLEIAERKHTEEALSLTKMELEVLPTIFVSARDDAHTRAQAMQAGALGFFGKPFSDEVLLRTVQTTLQLAGY